MPVLFVTAVPQCQCSALFVAPTAFEQQLSISEVCSPSSKEDTTRQSEYEALSLEGGEEENPDQDLNSA